MEGLIRISASVVLFGVMASVASTAQETPAPMKDQGQPLVYRENVNLVTVSFTVKGKRGAFIPNLAADQFIVTEDGKPQTIKYFSSENNVPLTLGILVDTSESMRLVLPKEKIVASDFLHQVLSDSDLAFVISFDLSVDLLQDLTSHVRLLVDGLDKAEIHAPVPVRIGRIPISAGNPKGTLLYDAIYLGASEMLNQQSGRKAMIILTDGVDQGSQLRLRDALAAAQKADAVCYVLLLYDPLYGNDLDQMKYFTEQTGGRTISVGNPDKLGNAFAEIANDLRSQYSLGYTPTNPKHDGTYRHISVKCKDGHKVQARKGYYAPVDSTPTH